MLKPSYSVDSSNRLVISREKNKIIPDGRFTISEGNGLTYWLNEPLDWRRKYGLTQEIKFEGNWKLNNNYDLELDLSQNTRKSPEEKIVLKGEIISTDRDTLAFEMKSQDKSGKNEFQIIKLSGSWASDKENSLIFLADKGENSDTLKLGVGWKLNKDQQIIYTYEKTNLKTKVKDIRVLTFSGAWEINQNNVLTYLFSTGSRSRFDFRAQIETPTIYPQAGKIKYRLGAGLKNDNSEQGKIITLYGVWKFDRKLGIIFEMEYGKGNVQALEFGADINLAPKDKIILSLVSQERKPLGLKVTFSHRFLKKLDAEAYLKFKALREESAVETGVKIPF